MDKHVTSSGSTKGTMTTYRKVPEINCMKQSHMELDITKVKHERCVIPPKGPGDRGLTVISCGRPQWQPPLREVLQGELLGNLALTPSLWGNHAHLAVASAAEAL